MVWYPLHSVSASEQFAILQTKERFDLVQEQPIGLEVGSNEYKADTDKADTDKANNKWGRGGGGQRRRR